MKKLLSLVLAMVMLLGVLSGCGEQPADNTTEAQTTGNTEAQPSEGATGAPVETHDPVTLHYYIPNTNAAQEDAEKVHAEVNKLIQAIYPWITVEFHISTSADYPTHVALAQALGNPIDIICTYKLSLASEITNGGVMDVTDMLADYPGLTSALPDFAYGWGQKDGRTYGFPNWQQCNYANDSIAIPKESASKYGLDIDALNAMIQSQEFFNAEVYDVLGNYLKTARDAGDESVVFLPGTTYLGNVRRGYEQVMSLFYYAWTDETCQLVNIYETQQYKDYLAAIAEYKAAGYIPDDYYSNTNAYAAGTVIKAGYSPIYFTGNAYVPNFPELRLKNWGVDLHFAATNKSVDEYYIGYNFASGLTSVGGYSEHPKDALRVIELLYTNEEIQNMLTYGLEGEHYTKNADGTITTLEYDAGQANSKASYGMYKWTLGNSALTWINQSFDQEFYNWAFEELPETGTVSNLIGFIAETNKIDAKLSQISTIITEYNKQLWCGVNDNWEEVYEEFLTKLEKAGVDTVQQILQAQIDAFLASK